MTDQEFRGRLERMSQDELIETVMALRGDRNDLDRECERLRASLFSAGPGHLVRHFNREAARLTETLG